MFSIFIKVQDSPQLTFARSDLGHTLHKIYLKDWAPTLSFLFMCVFCRVSTYCPPSAVWWRLFPFLYSRPSCAAPLQKGNGSKRQPHSPDKLDKIDPDTTDRQWLIHTNRVFSFFPCVLIMAFVLCFHLHFPFALVSWSRTSAYH